MSDFTPEDLISYLYGEMDDRLTARIEKALEDSWALREKLSVLKASIKRLEVSVPLSPSQATLDSIMAYAGDKSKIPQ
jgi:hypothetical protein